MLRESIKLQLPIESLGPIAYQNKANAAESAQAKTSAAANVYTNVTTLAHRKHVVEEIWAHEKPLPPAGA